MKKTSCILPLIVLMLATACKKQETGQIPDERPLPAAKSSSPENFTFNLYREVAAANPDKNVFLSPASARWALGMAYTGASGRTLEEMAAVLGARPVAENLEAEAGRIKSLMAADPKVTLRVANSLWLKKEFPFKESFVSSVRQSYQAEVFARNFVSADVAEANAWVSRMTEGKIPSIIGEFGSDSCALLLNAVYFKGNWSDQFKKERTRDEDFLLPSGKTVKRKLMNISGDYEYFEDKDFQAVRLPYGNKRLGMVVLLPGKSFPLARLNDRLTPAFWTETLNGMHKSLGDISLPRFKLEFAASLNEPLKAMGMRLAFDKEKADFSNIAKLPPAGYLFISGVLQKTFVEVNEEGTEAAAATAVMMAGAASAMPPPHFNFRADHPFLYAITDRETGEILFLGALYDPN